MMKDGKDRVPIEVVDRFQATKRQFARLRIPLAKMQPASGFAGEDNHIAYPGVDQEHGVAWQLNRSTVISRRELSDAFLEGLEFARAAKLREQALASQQDTESSDKPTPAAEQAVAADRDG
jgi:hypothetical protein